MKMQNTANMQRIGKLRVKKAGEIACSRVGVGFECVDRDLIRPEKCYDAIANAGIKWARVQTGWAKCEQKKGVYDFAWLDDMVDSLRMRGVIPWFNVGYGNPLYMPDAPNRTAVGCVPFLYGEDTMNAWLQYIHALAHHFKGRVTYYEIWNEPDITSFWYPGTPSGAELARLVSETGSVIRAEDPEARIGTCAFDPKLDTYLRVLFQKLKPGELQFYSIHSYETPPDDAWKVECAPIIRKMLARYGHADCELWLGECGHASWHPVGHGRCPQGGGSEHRQAVWLLRRYLLDLDAELRLTSFYEIADCIEKPYETATRVQKEPARQGLLNGLVYTPKKAYEVMGYIASLLAGDCVRTDPLAQVQKRTDTDTPLHTVSFLRDGKPAFAYWIAAPIEEERPVSDKCSILPADCGTWHHPMLIDLMSGVCYALNTLDDLPLGEYPFVLCDREDCRIE